LGEGKKRLLHEFHELSPIMLAFGLLMQLRKDLYVLVGFHLFVSLWLAFGEYHFAHLLGLR